MAIWNRRRGDRNSTSSLGGDQPSQAPAGPGNDIRGKEIEHPRDLLLTHLSRDLSTVAIDLHRRELERLSRKMAAAELFQGMLDSLKYQIACRGAVRTQFGFADANVELPSEAA